MEQKRIAFFPLLRTTFDVPYAMEMIEAARGKLLAEGFALIEPEMPISDVGAAQKAVDLLLNQPIDLLLIFQATFADSTMVTALTKGTTIPILLWAVPEPWTGDRLRLNALCGINLAGHALTRAGDKFDYAYGSPDDRAVIEKIKIITRAGTVIRRLRSAKLGVVGEHPEGFDSCNLDPETLHSNFGVKVEQIPLKTIFERARQVSDAEIIPLRAALDQRLHNLAELDPSALRGTLQVFLTLRAVAQEKNLDGLAVRCWPEFFTEMGCAACGAMSMLSDGFLGQTPLPCGCEADINGTLTQLILQWLSGEPSFGTDIVGVDRQNNLIALWHCGLAPLSMADPTVLPKGTIHSNRKLPLLMDFPLKPGKVTLARVSQAGGKLQLVMGEGEMIAAPKPFGGTAGTLRMNCSAGDFLDTLMYEGLEHHVSLTYGQFSSELRVIAHWIGLPVINF